MSGCPSVHMYPCDSTGRISLKVDTVGTSVEICRETPKFVKVKVKCTLVQALRLCTGHMAYRGNRGIALLFHDHGTRRG